MPNIFVYRQYYTYISTRWLREGQSHFEKCWLANGHGLLVPTTTSHTYRCVTTTTCAWGVMGQLCCQSATNTRGGGGDDRADILQHIGILANKVK